MGLSFYLNRNDGSFELAGSGFAGDGVDGQGLATGGSLIATVELLKRRGCADVRALVLVAAPEGIAALERAHPDVRCWTAAIDDHLDANGYIIPGLGDAGDKIFGTT